MFCVAHSNTEISLCPINKGPSLKQNKKSITETKSLWHNTNRKRGNKAEIVKIGVYLMYHRACRHFEKHLF